MNAAIRRTVTVQSGGVVHFAAPELHEGTQAEVIVLVPITPQPNGQLAAFRELQKNIALTPDAAEKWIRETNAEHKAFGSE
jgi:hypothetical protein